MLDFSHVGGTPRAITTYFYALNSTTEWQVWHKPRGCTMISIFCMGGAGGGGGGFGSSTRTARSGGGGGAAGGVTRVMAPALLLPDELYIQVGLGGTGGAGSLVASGAASSGNPGANSYVSLSTSITTANLLAYATGGGGGGPGNASAAGTAGIAAPVIATTNCPFITGAVFSNVVGLAGGLGGGINAAGPTHAMGAGVVNSGGSGGGGGANAGTAGGTISALPSNFALPGTLAGGAAATPGNGLNGFYSLNPPAFIGGTGGGASNSTTVGGGNGGDGSYGAGGGGGGAGGNTGGNGGAGGEGLVIITAW